MKNKIIFSISILFLLLIVIVAISFMSGPVNIPFTKFFSINEPDFLIVRLRLYRIILGIVAGASLATSGVIFQGLLRNPLAEPYLLGISSGASFGAVLSLTLGLGSINYGLQLLPIIAFLGGLLTVILVYNLARIENKVPIQTLLLAGVVVGTIFSSLVMFLVSISRSNQIHSVIWWLLGSLEVVDKGQLVSVGIITLIGIFMAIYYSRELNILSLGHESAVHIGVNVELMKKLLFITGSLLAASTVAVCGVIGFVGLIIPHIMRLIVGPDHRILIPTSVLSGAIFLVGCDILARNLLAPAELPIGVITAFLGGPFFIFLLRRKRGKFF